MNDINKRIATLSPAKRKLLEQRLQQKVKAASCQGTIPPRKNPQFAPLSFAQERMWLLDRLEPGNPAYNRPTNIRLAGSLNVAALEKAINEIVSRHEVLRTSFPMRDGQPVQEIAPSLRVNLPIIELERLSGKEREVEVQRIAVEEAQQKFDLSKLPLITAKLLRLEEGEHILLLTMHHIVFDGWSASVLREELAAHYEALVAGKSSPLPPLPIQYADFAVWQRQQLQRKGLESQLAYWKKQLGGTLPVLELPTDKPRSPVQTVRGAKQKLLLPQNLSGSLKELSLREGVTLFMTLLAAFKVLLYRYTGEEDIIVGTPVAGRDRSEIENLIGVFINTLVFRGNINGKETFRELLSRVRQVALEAYEHQDLPFEKLVEELQPDRDLSHTPVFQVLFQLRNLPTSTLTAGEIALKEVKFERGIAAFDLTLDIVETSQGLVCSFEYNADLFEAATIERMAGHFQVLLSGIAANPEQPVYQLPLLTEPEKHQLLVEWNDTATEYPQDKCVHQLFEEQVERTPDAVAVVFESEQLTYRQLNSRANQLAHYLRDLGVGPEVLVGICVERSLEMIVGLLGILKAGGAYVPLDPNYPTERFNHIINDTGLSILLTQHHLSDRVPNAIKNIVCLTDESYFIQKNENNCNFTIQSNNLAYAIYTSGSTGKPKGVLVEHKSLVNFLWFRNYKIFSETELKSGTLTTSICFDASVAQIFSPLIIGGKLVMVPDIEKLFFWLNKEQITCMTTVPSSLEQLLNNFTLPSCIRVIGLGGESVTESLLEKLGKYPNVKKVFNLYGPTEATIGSLSTQIFSNTS